MEKEHTEANEIHNVIEQSAKYSLIQFSMQKPKDVQSKDTYTYTNKQKYNNDLFKKILNRNA